MVTWMNMVNPLARDMKQKIVARLSRSGLVTIRQSVCSTRVKGYRALWKLVSL